MHLKDKIHTIRGKQVMLDRDLAELYGVKSRRLREQVKRNIEKFPDDFMFRITKKEFENMVSQNATPSKQQLGGHMPYVFTEYGVASLSGILKSKKATEINIKIVRTFVQMRKFLSQNAQIFQRLDRVEIKQIENSQKLLTHDKNFNKIFKAIEDKQITPKQGIFFDGQIFDAYKFITDLVKQAENNIILIDNYINEDTLTLLSNKKKQIIIKIYTKEINEQLKLAVSKFNQQYKNLEIIKHDKSHDRFLIIDNQTYHIGASIKDAGKKWFAFSKLNLNPLNKH